MKNFKSATVLRLNQRQHVAKNLLDGIDEMAVTELEEKLRKHACVDPLPSQWRSIGLAAVVDGLFGVSTGGTATLRIEWAERVLPSKVRDQHLGVLLDNFNRMEGRKPSRKEFAELRASVEHELLPKAFIRRSNVLVSIGHDTLILWSSSSKKVDEAVTLLMAVINDVLSTPMQVAALRTKNPVIGLLTAIAKGDSMTFKAGTAGTLERGDERISVKDLCLSKSEVVTLLEQDYRVTEMYLTTDDVGGRVNEHLVFKGLDIEEEKDSLLSSAFIALNTVFKLLTALLGELGEIRIEWDSEQAATTPEDEL